MVKDEVCGVLPYPHNFKTAPHSFTFSDRVRYQPYLARLERLSGSRSNTSTRVSAARVSPETAVLK